ncbi:hypothetical protein HT031_004943 [Scenedesmus sp. PABB004]|nr:hypothetical protein HT031_004943 [Scenedesmus sp. PABB004]
MLRPRRPPGAPPRGAAPLPAPGRVCQPPRPQLPAAGGASGAGGAAGAGDEQQAQQQAQRQAQQQQQQQEQEQQEQQFGALAERLRGLGFAELEALQEAAAGGDEAAAAAFRPSFLFWLAAQERRAAGGPRRAELAGLAAQLVVLKERAEAAASARLLPPLASSLAYANYRAWQAEHAGGAPASVGGVPLDDLYRAAEREEAKLQQWRAPPRAASSLDGFAAASGYKQMAAAAMARARARFSGWSDDGDDSGGGGGGDGSGDAAPGGEGEQRLSPAATQVVRQLLLGCCCREERATVLPEAFSAPGLEVEATGTSARPMRVMSTPQRVLAVVAAELRALGQAQQPQPLQQSQFQAQQAQPLEQVQQPQPLEQGQQRSPLPAVLPSGEAAADALRALAEDVGEYDAAVYSRQSRRDRLGLL